ncbi:transglycosylase family protein, partial [Staphylococcus cohnii]
TQEQTQPQQASSEQPAQEQAPQTEQTQQPQQESASSQQSTDSSSEASSGSSVDVNDHLKQIAQRESGGDLNAVNPSSGAAGKYQFLQSTWDSVAPAEYKGVSPTEAPESVQDQAAMDLYESEGASQWVTA